MWSGKRLTKIQATTRPENLWPDVRSKMEKATKKKEKHEWVNEKPKLDNARYAAQRLRGLYFIDPEDGEYKQTIKKKQGTVGHSKGGGVALQKRNKEALRVSGNWGAEWWIQQDSKDTAYMHRGGSWLHEKAFRFTSTENSWRSQIDESLQLGTQIYSDGQGMKIRDAKAAVDRELKKLETTPAWQLDKMKSKKVVILEAQRDKHKVHFSTLMDVQDACACGWCVRLLSSYLRLRTCLWTCPL